MTNFDSRHEYSLNIDDTAEWYLEQMQLVDHYKRNLNMKYMELRYEDLVEKSEETLRGVLNIIGVDWDPVCLDFYKSKRKVRTASYAQVTRDFYKDSLERHVHYTKYLQNATEILAPLLESYK